MTLDDSILTWRRHVIRRAAELGSASAACREAGISRTLFYRWQRRLERYGIEGLHPRRQQARPGRPPQVPPHVERLVLGQALAWPTWGCGRLAAQLARERQLRLAASTVQRILRRGGRGVPARSPGYPRAPGRQDVRAADRTDAPPAGPSPQPEPARACGAARRSGQVDTFYIGKLKGVGKVWQITACDAACSYGVAWLLPALSAEAAATFLSGILVPLYRRAGWPLQRVLTDGGSEFKGAFAEACQRLGIRHTRTKPRHAWTNGFVERLQGTLLHEHWRIEFRRQYFTSRAAMQRTLDAFMKFYNEQRPHQGYRLRGRVPAELFWGAAAAAS